jgi:hypothetical protein
MVRRFETCLTTAMNWQLEDGDGVLQLVGFTCNECENMEDFIHTSNVGRLARSTTATGANATSSRKVTLRCFSDLLTLEKIQIQDSLKYVYIYVLCVCVCVILCGKKRAPRESTRKGGYENPMTSSRDRNGQSGGVKSHYDDDEEEEAPPAVVLPKKPSSAAAALAARRLSAPPTMHDAQHAASSSSSSSSTSAASRQTTQRKSMPPTSSSGGGGSLSRSGLFPTEKKKESVSASSASSRLSAISALKDEFGDSDEEDDNELNLMEEFNDDELASMSELDDILEETGLEEYHDTLSNAMNDGNTLAELKELGLDGAINAGVPKIKAMKLWRAVMLA